MDEQIIEIWKPIEFTNTWRDADTSILDDLAPSWFSKRVEFKDGNVEYEEFINRLKRQHAIETGVVEKLYDLSEGITQTFIKEGFIESYLSHDDTNIPPKQLMGFLQDHFLAMDFIFDLVKNERPLSVSFIKQLHQLITKNQDYTDGIDSLGNRVRIKLLKGEFKQSPNNPRRQSGEVFAYCPPIHVLSEMDKLIEIHNELWEEKVSPVIISAWVHHAFTQIHPFQDGNGRIARLLASLILIRGQLFPFTVKRDEKPKYIRALENADSFMPQDLVSFFCEVQKRNIENALNYKIENPQTSIAEVAQLFTKKVEIFTSKKREQRQVQLKENRNKIFNFLYELLGNIQKELFREISIDKAEIKLTSARPEEKNHFWYNQQIAEYATVHHYYFNKLLPRGWFKISFALGDNRRYDIIISVHHFGYDDSVIAIGAFLEFVEKLPDGLEKEDKTSIPINLKPYTISLEQESTRLFYNLEQYMRDVVRIGLTIIANEIA
jgi:Fic family protein